MMDTLICGNCQASFHDLQAFVDHKNNGCTVLPLPQQAGIEDVGAAQYNEGEVQETQEGECPIGTCIHTKE